MKESCEVIENIICLFDFPEKFKAMEEYLMMNSNLPGPRGNLTLAYKFGECFEKKDVNDELLKLLIGWTEISPEEAPVNNPKEYLPFCGVFALGSHYCWAHEKVKALILDRLKAAMKDERWRMRESAAMAFQKIGEKDFAVVEKYFSLWYPNSDFLEKRAFIAALAHPPILKDKAAGLFSLKISENILKDILSLTKEQRHSEGFKILSKGLQYALSVFTEGLPEEGFEMFNKYASLGDKDMDKIIKSNLGKARLSKKYPIQTEKILKKLQ